MNLENWRIFLRSRTGRIATLVLALFLFAALLFAFFYPHSVEGAEEVTYAANIPVVMKTSDSCLNHMPQIPFEWQLGNGFGVCSFSQPPVILGYEPVPASSFHYNWFYPDLVGLMGEWVTGPDSWGDEHILVHPNQPFGIVTQCSGDCPNPAFEKVYGIVGPDFDVDPITAQVVLWYHFTNNTWSTNELTVGFVIVAVVAGT